MYIVDEVSEMRIKELREARGLLQKDLGRALDIAANTLSQYENGKREPDLETTQRIADFFGVSVDCLLGREGREKAPGAGEGVTLDSFTYAMQEETRDLTEMDKQILLSMARQLNDARKRRDGESG